MQAGDGAEQRTRDRCGSEQGSDHLFVRIQCQREEIRRLHRDDERSGTKPRGEDRCSHP